MRSWVFPGRAWNCRTGTCERTGRTARPGFSTHEPGLCTVQGRSEARVSPGEARAQVRSQCAASSPNIGESNTVERLSWKPLDLLSNPGKGSVFLLLVGSRASLHECDVPMNMGMRSLTTGKHHAGFGVSKSTSAGQQCTKCDFCSACVFV